MDGRDGMAIQGTSPYYLSRGGSGSLPNVHGGGGGSPSAQATRVHHPTPRFNNPINQFQPNVNLSGSSTSVSPFHHENPPSSFTQTVTTSSIPSSEPLNKKKKKRGRPRKYGSEGVGANMSLGLSPLSAPKASSEEKGRRGRPPGTGWKQKLAPLGEWMNSSAGVAFSPHVLHIGVGEDVAGKILAFAQQRPRALCIMSANGSVSAVTLRQPTNSGGAITYEGRFEILCLSGSYLVAEIDGPGNRTGGISISVCSPEGVIIGGALGGKLIAATPVEVVGCSFVYGNPKLRTKEDKAVLEHSPEKSLTPLATPNSGHSAWIRAEGKPFEYDIDLTHG